MMVDDIGLFRRLAEAMNADPARYELLGDLDLDLALVMRRPDQDPFLVLLRFQDIGCETVVAIDDGDQTAADCWLEGDVDYWEAMFADISSHGRATGEWTLNTLTIMGERLQLRSADPMGWDKFHRYNQTLQEFFDAASSVLDQEVSDVRT